MRMAMATATVAVSVLLVLSSFTPSKSDPDFDVRQHLSTVTRSVCLHSHSLSEVGSFG
uniref:Uncharacterized protein n=1 Tax=Rhizophora mucronata TaxID=61149 RepID=A0A2P2L8Z0_RHIMU